MNILVCDDVPNEAEKLSGLLKSLGYNPVTFSSSADVLEHFRAGNTADVCILDIVMPEMSGLELAKKLRESGFGGEIIFLSASGEYGPQTYEVKAFHYLLKPPALESLGSLLDEIKTRREKADTEGIKLKAAGKIRFILFREIEFAEVVRNYVSFCLMTGESMEIRATFAEIAPQLLCDSRFIQCHQSYIVNMDAIASILTREITMRDGAKIPVSKSYPDTKMRYLNRGLRGNQK